MRSEALRSCWWLAPCAGALGIITQRASSPAMLADSDTAFLLRVVREREDPMSWFGSDWPLGNHFYRPISTLTFELDNALYHDAAWGYGLTNAILAASCVMLLAWFAWELTRDRWISGGSALLFAWWTLDWMPIRVLQWIALGCVLWVVFRDLCAKLPAIPWPSWALVGLTAWLALHELGGMSPLRMRMIEWLPGRTASTMTAFVLIALAAYARTLRLEPGWPRRGWIVVTILGLILALGSYEQAVMAPAVLLGVWGVGRIMGLRAPWVPHMAFLAALGAYLLLRGQFVPSEVSGYQAQQLRFGIGAWLAIGGYVAPLSQTFVFWQSALAIGPAILMVPATYVNAGFGAANVAGFWAAWRSRAPWQAAALAGWGLSWIAFLPMGWLKPFAHYDYWPMAMRTLLVVGLIGALVEAMHRSRPNHGP